MMDSVKRYSLLTGLAILILLVISFDFINQLEYSKGKYPVFFAYILAIVIIAGKLISEFMLFLSTKLWLRIVGASATILLFIVAIYINTEVRSYNSSKDVNSARSKNMSVVNHNKAIDKKAEIIRSQIKAVEDQINIKADIIKNSPKEGWLNKKLSREIDKLSKSKIALSGDVAKLMDQKIIDYKEVLVKKETKTESLVLSILVEFLLILFVIAFTVIYKNKVVVVTKHKYVEAQGQLFDVDTEETNPGETGDLFKLK